MSIKTVLDCIKNEFSQRKRSTQERIYNDKKIEERLRQIQFDDISESFPKEFFILDFDPLYSFYRIIRRRDVALFSSTYSKDSYLSGLLDNLFKEKEIGKKQLFFSDFSGVLNSKDSGKYSFADFKKEQFERNISDPHYKDYKTLRHHIFDVDEYGNSNVIKDALILKWSNTIYAYNSDRSHRFALLCEWNDCDKQNDSEIFDVTELSINVENKNKFQENYYGFIVSENTANEIFNAYTDNSFMNWQIYCPFPYAGNGNMVGLIFQNIKSNKNIINIFKNSKNSVNINDLLIAY